MKAFSRWHVVALAGLGLALTSSTGCQTNVAGMTLPSGHYMNHPPQYIAPSPTFPLQRELATMESQNNEKVGGTPAPAAAPTQTAPVTPAAQPAAPAMPPAPMK